MRLGFAMCGSYCTHSKALLQMTELSENFEIQPIMSESVYCTDTYFGSCSDLRTKVQKICGREIIHTIKDAEPLGPKKPLDIMIICPCTGNTLAKIAMGITDTSVTMAAKAHLRSDRPLVIALASNDALSANLKNIATLLSRKHVFFVPMHQDDPEKKPHSLVCDFTLVPEVLELALKEQQYSKLFI